MKKSNTGLIDPIDIDEISFQRTVEFGFLCDDELDAFTLLIRNRRSLPAYYGDFWGCMECSFTSLDLVTMARHILTEHSSTPVNQADLEEMTEAKN